MTKLPDLPADTSGASGSGPTRAAIAKDLRSGGILLVRITDAAAAGDWVKKTMAAKGLSVSSSQYATAQLITGTPTAGGPTASVAVLPDIMILGETSNVKTVVDANGKGGLAGTAGFQTAAKAVATENLAAWFVNVRQYVTWFSSVGAARGMASCPAITDTIPEWVGGAMTAESTALTSESVLPHVAGGPSTTNVRSTLPSHLPASTLLMLDRHDAGASIVQAVDKARSCAGPNAEVFDRIDSAIQGMGGWSGLTGWIGETALVVARDGDEPTGGVAVVPVDAAKADAFKTQLKNLLVLAGSSVTSTEETYAGTTLTVISSPKEGACSAEGCLCIHRRHRCLRPRVLGEAGARHEARGIARVRRALQDRTRPGSRGEHLARLRERHGAAGMGRVGRCRRRPPRSTSAGRRGSGRLTRSPRRGRSETTWIASTPP